MKTEMTIRYACKNCAINKVDIDGILCNECRAKKEEAKAIIWGMIHGRGTPIAVAVKQNHEESCDHDCEWDYFTRSGERYGMEYTIEGTTCHNCGEVMEQEMI